MYTDITWNDVAYQHPEFVAWVVQRYGPLPEGPVIEEDYERYRTAWERSR
jgi:hypothetical protein